MMLRRQFFLMIMITVFYAGDMHAIVIRYGDMIELTSVSTNTPVYLYTRDQNLTTYGVACRTGNFLDNWWIVKPAFGENVHKFIGKPIRPGDRIRLEHVIKKVYLRPDVIAPGQKMLDGKLSETMPVIATNRGSGFLNYDEDGTDDAGSDWVVEGPVDGTNGDSIVPLSVVRLKHHDSLYYLSTKDTLSEVKIGEKKENLYDVDARLKQKIYTPGSVDYNRLLWKITKHFLMPDLRARYYDDQGNPGRLGDTKEGATRKVILVAFPDRDIPQYVYAEKTDRDGVITKIKKINRDISQQKKPSDVVSQEDPLVCSILRNKGVIGFYADAFGGSIKSSKDFNVYCSSGDFEKEVNQHWWPSPDLQKNGFLKFMNHQSQGFLANPSTWWSKDLLWTSMDQKKAAGEKDGTSFLLLDQKTLDMPSLVNDSAKKQISYIPGYDSPYGLFFDEAWKLPDMARGCLTFSVQAREAVAVVFSSKPFTQGSNMYYLLIGAKGNSMIRLSKGMYGTPLERRLPPIPGENVQSQQKKYELKAPILQDGFNQIWVQINGDIISCGSGDKPTFESAWYWWQDSDPLPFVKYIGLGGCGESVEIKDMTISALPPASQKSVMMVDVGISKNFKKIAGAMNFVTLGSQKGRLVLWGIDNKNIFYEYSYDKKEWFLKSIKDENNQDIKNISYVTLTTDGSAGLIASGEGYVLDNNRELWKKITFPVQGVNVNTSTDVFVKNISLASLGITRKQEIWALDLKNKKIYEKGEFGWIERSNRAVGLSVAFDGTIIGLNDEGKPYQYSSIKKEWLKIPDVFVGSDGKKTTLVLEKIIAQGSAVYYGITRNMEFVVYDRYTQSWSLVQDAARPIQKVLDISINASGTMILLMYDGSIYQQGDIAVSPQAYAIPILPTELPAKQPGTQDNKDKKDQGMIK